jgi:hypothetical protein
MPRYLISFDAHAMDHIPDEGMPAVTNASLAVVQEAINAGVWIFGGAMENQKASIVATDGTVTDGSAVPETEWREGAPLRLVGRRLSSARSPRAPAPRSADSSRRTATR